MRILFFSSYWHPYVSGALTCARRVALDWVALGHRVQVATFRYDRRLSTRQMDQGVEIVRLGGFARVSKGFVAPVVLSRLLPLIARADLVVLNLPAFEGVRVALGARALGRPVLSIFNCEVDLGAGRWNRLVTRTLAASVRLQLALSRRVVTWSRDYADHCPALEPHAGRLRCILPPAARHPVDPAYLARLLEQKQGRRWVGFCGRLAREKGLDTLARAMTHVKDLDAELVLAGPGVAEGVAGEAAFERRLRAQLAGSGVPHRFLGLLSEEQLGAFYRSLDVLALPSVNRTEAFGVVQAEAMLHGTPVVASDRPGVRVAVGLTGQGMLARPGDPVDLADKLRRVLEPGGRPPLVASPEDVFDPQVFRRAWEEVLRELTRDTC